MTWIFAQPHFFGQVVALSDIQVTFEHLDGSIEYRDCLQKMYAVDKNIIAGFAGNVLGGLTLISSLSDLITQSKKDNTDFLFEPDEIISKWSKNLTILFNRLLPEAKEGGIQMLIAGVSHTIDLGIPGYGKPYVAIFDCDDSFTPLYADMSKWLSIGSGSNVSKYISLLNKLSGEETWKLAQMEVNNRGGLSNALGIVILSDVQKLDEVEGISKHFHIAIVSREGIFGGTSDHTEIPVADEDVIVYKMPNVAHNLTEYLAYVRTEFADRMIARAIA